MTTPEDLVPEDVVPEDVLRFWLHEKGPEDWYAGGAALDGEIAARFGAALDRAAAGRLAHWQADAPGTLAFLLLTDQFSRNIHRGTARAYATDPLARAAASLALHKEFDLATPLPQRQFFYLPFMHAESLTLQQRSVRLILTRLPGMDASLLHARAHREIIRLYGRFPFRNPHLGRADTPRERAFMQAGAYPAFVKAMQAAA